MFPFLFWPILTYFNNITKYKGLFHKRHGWPRINALRFAERGPKLVKPKHLCRTFAHVVKCSPCLERFLHIPANHCRTLLLSHSSPLRCLATSWGIWYEHGRYGPGTLYMSFQGTTRTTPGRCSWQILDGICWRSRAWTSERQDVFASCILKDDLGINIVQLSWIKIRGPKCLFKDWRNPTCCQSETGDSRCSSGTCWMAGYTYAHLPGR